MAVEALEGGHIDEDKIKVWDLTDLRPDSERGPSPLEFVKSLCDSSFFLVPIPACKAQKLIEDDIRAHFDAPRLETAVKTKVALVVSFQKGLNKQF